MSATAKPPRSIDPVSVGQASPSTVNISVHGVVTSSLQLHLLHELARVAAEATLHPQNAARELWGKLAPQNNRVAAIALGFADVPMDALSKYEATAGDVLIQCDAGGLWLLARCPRKEFDGQYPWVTVRQLRALGLALADLLTTEEAPGRKDELELRDAAGGHAAKDLTENDFA